MSQSDLGGVESHTFRQSAQGRALTQARHVTPRARHAGNAHGHSAFGQQAPWSWASVPGEDASVGVGFDSLSLSSASSVSLSPRPQLIANEWPHAEAESQVKRHSAPSRHGVWTDGGSTVLGGSLGASSGFLDGRRAKQRRIAHTYQVAANNAGGKATKQHASVPHAQLSLPMIGAAAASPICLQWQAPVGFPSAVAATARPPNLMAWVKGISKLHTSHPDQRGYYGAPGVPGSLTMSELQDQYASQHAAQMAEHKEIMQQQHEQLLASMPTLDHMQYLLAYQQSTEQPSAPTQPIVPTQPSVTVDPTPPADSIAEEQEDEEELPIAFVIRPSRPSSTMSQTRPVVDGQASPKGILSRQSSIAQSTAPTTDLPLSSPAKTVSFDSPNTPTANDATVDVAPADDTSSIPPAAAAPTTTRQTKSANGTRHLSEDARKALRHRLYPSSASSQRTPLLADGVDVDDAALDDLIASGHGLERTLVLLEQLEGARAHFHSLSDLRQAVQRARRGDRPIEDSASVAAVLPLPPPPPRPTTTEGHALASVVSWLTSPANRLFGDRRDGLTVDASTLDTLLKRIGSAEALLAALQSLDPHQVTLDHFSDLLQVIPAAPSPPTQSSSPQLQPEFPPHPLPALMVTTTSQPASPTSPRSPTAALTAAPTAAKSPRARRSAKSSRGRHASKSPSRASHASASLSPRARKASPSPSPRPRQASPSPSRKSTVHSHSTRRKTATTSMSFPHAPTSPKGATSPRAHMSPTLLLPDTPSSVSTAVPTSGGSIKRFRPSPSANHHHRLRSSRSAASVARDAAVDALELSEESRQLLRHYFSQASAAPLFPSLASTSAADAAGLQPTTHEVKQAVYESGGSVDALLAHLDTFLGVARSFASWGELVRALREARLTGSHVTESARLALLNFLSSHECTLFRASTETPTPTTSLHVQIASQGMDALLASARGLDATLEHLRTLDLCGRKVRTFAELSTVILVAIRKGTHVLPAEQSALRNYLVSSHLFDAPLTYEDTNLSGADFDRFFRCSGKAGLPGLIAHFDKFTVAGRSFRGLLELLVSLERVVGGDSHVPESTREALVDYLVEAADRLFDASVSDSLTGADLDQIVYAGRGLDDAIEHMRAFEAVHRRFPHITDLILAVRASHDSHCHLARADQRRLEDALTRPSSTLLDESAKPIVPFHRAYLDQLVIAAGGDSARLEELLREIGPTAPRAKSLEDLIDLVRQQHEATATPPTPAPAPVPAYA